jgi:hypothetical protein
VQPDRGHTDTIVNVLPLAPKPDGKSAGPQAWNSGVNFASARQTGRWTAELSIPKSAFPDPQNAIWGFNIVRHIGPDPATKAPPVITTWNQVIGDPRKPSAFGHLAFEAKPCYIKAAGLELPRRGTNTLNVAVVNQSRTNMELVGLVIVRRADTPTAAGQENAGREVNRYKFTLNAGEGQWLALDFFLDFCNNYSIEFDLFDSRSKARLARVTRRSFAVKPMIEVRGRPEIDKEGVVTTHQMLNLPSALLQKASLSATLRATTERATAAYVQVGKLLSDHALITVDGSKLAPATYILRATVTLASVGADSSEARFAIPWQEGPVLPPGVRARTANAK